MFVLGNLVATLAQIINTFLSIYTWVIIARVLISWVSPDPFNPIVQFLMKVTDPVLEPFRRVIPPIGGIDISPVVALLVIQALQHFLVKTLVDIGLRLR